jgi:anti-sigma regulatory factor (Ser/Thr protein kinase)
LNASGEVLRSRDLVSWGEGMSSLTGTTRGFHKSIGSVAEVFAFLDAALGGVEVGARSRLVLQLAVEELFTNMVKYNSGQSREIVVEVRASDDRIQVQLTDPDTDPFDPATVEPVEVDAPIDRRRRGGLGLHLVRSMADAVDYDYEGREMRVSVTTRLE